MPLCLQLEKVGHVLLREALWGEGECSVSLKRGGKIGKDGPGMVNVEECFYLKIQSFQSNEMKLNYKNITSTFLGI